MTETVADIAARYGASVDPDLRIRKVPAGLSGLPSLVWDEQKGVIQAAQPELWKWSFSGRPPKPVTVDGRTWPSMVALARHLGVSTASVSNAAKRGRLAEMVRRHSRGANE
jgi:hypothetical protein